MKPYSKDLRLKILAACDRGMPRKEVSRIFGVSEPTIRRYLRLRRETGGVDPRPVPGPPARKGEALGAALPSQVERNPDLTLEEHRELFHDEHGLEVSTASVSRALKRLGLPLKKVPPGLRARRARARRVARGGSPPRPAPVGVRGRVRHAHLHGSFTRLRARAPRGERAYGRVPRNRGKNTTLLASMTHEGMGPSMAVVGSTKKAVFEAYVEWVLAPSLSEGQVVILDNLGAHRSERARELVEARGCSLLFLPPYSPDFSPIEEAFSKIKALLRKAQAREREALVEAIGRALSAVTANDARGWFGHCGYPLDAQPS